MNTIVEPDRAHLTRPWYLYQKHSAASLERCRLSKIKVYRASVPDASFLGATSIPPASHQNAARRAAGHSAGRLVSSVDYEPNAKAGGSLWIIWQPRSQALARAPIDCKRRRRFHDFGAGWLWTRIFFQFRSQLYLKSNNDTFRTVYCTQPESVRKLLQRGVSESDTTYPFPIGRRPTAVAPRLCTARLRDVLTAT